jgi:hypothetical protein
MCCLHLRQHPAADARQGRRRTRRMHSAFASGIRSSIVMHRGPRMHGTDRSTTLCHCHPVGRVVWVVRSSWPVGSWPTYSHSYMPAVSMEDICQPFPWARVLSIHGVMHEVCLSATGRSIGRRHPPHMACAPGRQRQRQRPLGPVDRSHDEIV